MSPSCWMAREHSRIALNEGHSNIFHIVSGASKASRNHFFLIKNKFIPVDLQIMGGGGNRKTHYKNIEGV